MAPLTPSPNFSVKFSGKSKTTFFFADKSQKLNGPGCARTAGQGWPPALTVSHRLRQSRVCRPLPVRPGQRAGLVKNKGIGLGQISKAPPFLMTMPRLADLEMPEIMAIGVASISGQGVATTSTASKRMASCDKPGA